MRKHLYFYVSNLEQTKEIRNDDRFEPVPEYDSYELPLTSRNEYGRIKTNQNYYHILVGKLEQEGCPWCGHFAQIVKVDEDVFMQRAIYCIQCTKCGARGPMLNIDVNVENNETVMSHFNDLLWTRYKHRRPWDDGFKNHYEC